MGRKAGQPQSAGDGRGFAHPVERELARLLEEHGVAWEYEPHSFVLKEDLDGGRLAHRWQLDRLAHALEET